MRITVAAVGKIREKWIADGIAEYSKRLRRFGRLEIVEVADETIGSGASINQIRLSVEKEGARLLAKWPERARGIAMDLGGRALGSEGLAHYIDDRALSGDHHLVFAIGGSHGLAPAVLSRCRDSFSFGPNTFPHRLFRVMLLEQIYRAEKIRSGETYHK